MRAGWCSRTASREGKSGWRRPPASASSPSSRHVRSRAPHRPRPPSEKAGEEAQAQCVRAGRREDAPRRRRRRAGAGQRMRPSRRSPRRRKAPAARPLSCFQCLHTQQARTAGPAGACSPTACPALTRAQCPLSHRVCGARAASAPTSPQSRQPLPIRPDFRRCGCTRSFAADLWK